MTTHELGRLYDPIREVIQNLPVLGVAEFGQPCPAHPWFWAQGKKMGRKFAYHALDNGNVAILRLK